MGGEEKEKKNIKNKRKSLRIFRTSKRLCCQNVKESIEQEINIKKINAQLLSLPIEVLLEILSYLTSQDFYSLRNVSEYFYNLEPLVWKVYQVEGIEVETNDVIKQLKRLTLLKQININGRSDCDEILHQLSRTNKNLEILNITNCTGSTSQLYLRSCNLTRILERCCRLHTINIIGSRFRGKKFYCLLGKMGVRLRAILSPATSTQFRSFIKHANHLNEHDREIMCAMCNNGKIKTWSPLHYFIAKSGEREEEEDDDDDEKTPTLELSTPPQSTNNYFNNNIINNTTTILKQQQQRRALVSYLYNDFISIYVANENNNPCAFIVPELPPPPSSSSSLSSPTTTNP